MPDASTQRTLTFEIERNGESAIVHCHGRLVLGVADDLYPTVKPLFDDTKTVVIDLEDLAYVDSMGLGTLVRLYVSARNSGCQLKVEHLGKQVRNALSITHLLSVFAQAEDDNITIA